jgi:hypothetical protein
MCLSLYLSERCFSALRYACRPGSVYEWYGRSVLGSDRASTSTSVRSALNSVHSYAKETVLENSCMRV